MHDRNSEGVCSGHTVLMLTRDSEFSLCCMTQCYRPVSP